MEDRIRHGGRWADDSDFSEAFYAEGADLVVLSAKMTSMSSISAWAGNRLLERIAGG